MFAWSAFPEALDNNYEELESAAPSSPPSPHPPASAPALTSTSLLSSPQTASAPSRMLPRSVSTSHVDTAPPFDASGATPYPASSSSSWLPQRSADTASLSETGSPMMSPASIRPPTGSTFKVPGPSADTSTKGAGRSAARGQQQQQMQQLLLQQQLQQAALSLEPPTTCWWYPKKSAGLPDFVLISEFSELEGPRAVMTIPDNIVDLTRDSYSSHKQRSQESSDGSTATLSPDASGGRSQEEMFDTHEFVLRITSADQQVRETSSIFHIPEDIEVHISDPERGYWAYVHHFTLFDINARGFVRPFSMSYITQDPNKILAHYEEMRLKFSRATLYFKTGNYTLFRQDLTKKLRNLNYTNNLLSEAPADLDAPSDSSAMPTKPGLVSESSQNTLTESSDSSELSSLAPAEHSEGLSEQQRVDLESIKEAIETATHIISILEHYSVDGQPLLGHAEDGTEGPHTMVPLSDLSPMTSSENLAQLAAGRSGAADSSLFLGSASRPGSRIRHKISSPSVIGMAPSRILDSTGTAGVTGEGLTAPLPHLLGLQQEQSRKNSVVSEYDSMMYEAPEYEAQYVTTLYPIDRDEVVFRPLRELCVATMVWNSSIQFHLGIKKIKDILKDFQADTQLLGEVSDNAKRMYPTASSLTLGNRFLINFRNPEFNRITARQTPHQEAPVPLMELLEGISTANAPSEDGQPVQGATSGTLEDTTMMLEDSAPETRQPGQAIDADDADDEQTGYDSLDDAVSFFTAATGMATHIDTPTRDGFSVTPLDRSARVVEWHQEQQTLHHAKRSGPIMPSTEGAAEQVPWSFGAGVSQGEPPPAGGFSKSQHRHSAQSGLSMGVAGPGSGPGPGPAQNMNNPTIILDTLQKDPTISKHLVFALLSGQKVCVMGQTESEAKVRAMVSVLSTFLPHAGYPSREEQLMEHQRQVVPWYQGPGALKVEDMERYSLVGVDSSRMDPKFLEADICILDFDTLIWVHGQQYTDGILLESIFRSMTLFSEDSSFVAFADGKLFEILLKAFLYYHLVFHGRLYQGGLLSYPGAQSFYSSGASDDGEAFSHQSNFRNSRQSPVVSRSGGLSRAIKKGNTGYPGSTNFGGSMTHYRSSHTRSGSASSHESSDLDRSVPDWRDPKLHTRHEHAENSQHLNQHQQYDRSYGDDNYRDKVELSEDDSGQNGMQYTTSQGMRKWKKWFEYWSAKSVAMIDPALAAFGRPESAAPADGNSGGPNWRKRSNSRRSSPSRRHKNSPSHHHQSPSRIREAREREKERDRERDRERHRKTTFDHYSITKEKVPMFSSSDSEFPRGDDTFSAMTGNPKNMKDTLEPSESRAEDLEGYSDHTRAEDAWDNMADALNPKPNSGKGTGSRRLKPKRPLTLHGSFSKSSQREEGKKEGRDAATAVAGATLTRTPSSGSAASPPPSATFRSLAGAFRAMSFGSSATATTVKGSTASNASIGYLSSPTKNQDRHSIEEHHSGRSSRDLSDSVLDHREVKRRGSARAKAKAWFKAKRKRRSWGHVEDGTLHKGGDVDEQRSGPSDEEHDISDAEGSREGQRISSPDDDGQPQEEEIDDAEQETRDHGPPPKSAPARAESASATAKMIPPIQSHSAIDLTEALSKPVELPDEPLPLDTHLTIQEIATLEPTTRTQSRVLMMPTVSAATINAVSSSNNSSRISSANGSRITSPLVPSFAADPRQRMESISALISRRKDSRPLLKTEAEALLSAEDLRSEVDDSEQDRRWDLGKESATEYETSAETFANDRASSVSGPVSGNQRFAESSGRPSLDATPSSASQTKGSSSYSSATMKAYILQQDPALGDKMKMGLGKSDKDTVTLTEEEELAVREMIGGVTGADDWIIIVHLATMVDEYERSKGSDTAAMD
ncbi:Guanine nucleotide exchange protein smcr8 [Mortierella alpina]|uniref:Guanine nucleotide exchange protein smcr8 n=1 Tax=Mortierella alpina TaxID=64518 RepID=A0A9P6JEM7_MORAP|nr:Guanine nucleotide exchange protein smcr8 [Mortierella alpina]